MFLFLIFSMICIQIAIGGEGRGGEGSSRSGRQREFKGQGSASGHDRGHDGVHPFSFDPNEAKQYKIGIYTRRFDGGSVLVLKNYEIEENLIFEKGTYNIEYILNTLKIANVQYNEDGTVGKVHFLQDYVLGVAKGANMPITDLVQLIANWEKRENGETIWAVNGVITRDTIFEPLLDGHVMAQFYNENNREEFRLHLTSNGLNFYDMSHGVSYFIKEEDGNVNIKLDEKNTTICQTHYIRIIEDIFFKIGGKKSMFLCGKKEHTESEIHIYTRPLTLYQILNIAYYHVSEGNPITNNFKCHHFIYALILAIVEGKRDKKILLNYNAWPMGIRDLDEALKGDGITAFDQVKNNFKMRYTNLNDENFKARIPFIPPGEEQEEE